MVNTYSPYGLIEGGGTKFVCAVGLAVNDIQNRKVFPTRGPGETICDIVEYFKAYADAHGPLSGIGVGCFGPLDLSPASNTFGQITDTPKPGWSGFNIRETLKNALRLPVSLDTDVHCALLAEAHYGAGVGYKDLIYVTVGTGIGAGIMIDGDILYGAGHPEVGHMLTPLDPQDAGFKGVCPFHGHQCFEGVASGPAIQNRWSQAASDLPKDHPAWDMQARYLAKLCMNMTMMAPPSRIILGGGVMQQGQILEKIRTEFEVLKNGYNGLCTACHDTQTYIVASKLQPDAGLIGAFELARMAR